MKRFFALAAALLMLLSFASCGKQDREKFIRAEITAETAWLLSESGNLYAVPAGTGDRQVTPAMKQAESIADFCLGPDESVTLLDRLGNVSYLGGLSPEYLPEPQPGVKAISFQAVIKSDGTVRAWTGGEWRQLLNIHAEKIASDGISYVVYLTGDHKLFAFNLEDDSVSILAHDVRDFCFSPINEVSYTADIFYIKQDGALGFYRYADRQGLLGRQEETLLPYEGTAVSCFGESFLLHRKDGTFLTGSLEGGAEPLELKGAAGSAAGFGSWTVISEDGSTVTHHQDADPYFGLPEETAVYTFAPEE